MSDWREEAGIPRRACVDKMTPAELAIVSAVEAVEAAGADERLTHAVIALQRARDHVADFVDGVPRGEGYPRPVDRSEKEHALLLDVATAATVALYKFGDEYEGRLGPVRNAIDALMAFRSPPVQGTATDEVK